MNWSISAMHIPPFRQGEFSHNRLLIAENVSLILSYIYTYVTCVSLQHTLSQIISYQYRNVVMFSDMKLICSSYTVHYYLSSKLQRILLFFRYR